MRRLILLICLIACAKAAPPATPAAFCYALDWSDSTWAPLLPGTVRLVEAPDTLLPANYPYRLLRPVNQTDTLGWAHLMNAWWMQGPSDSLLMILDGVDSGWRVSLHRFGDSLTGVATYRSTNDQQAAMLVRGHRFACPNDS